MFKFELSKTMFCDLVAKARSIGFPGSFSGSSFRNHPCFLRRGHLLLKNNWHVCDYCSASVIVPGDAEMRLGSQESCAHGNPDPIFAKGTRLLEVYDTGRWIEEGPWMRQILELLREVNLRAEEVAAARAAEEKRKRVEHEQARQSLINAAAEACIS